MNIRFFKPILPPWEVIGPKIQGIIDSGILTTGPYTEQFEKEFAKYSHAKYATMTSSCTTGLMLLFSVLKKKSEAIVPATTFVATYEALMWNHVPAKIVDVDGQDGMISPGIINERMRRRTSAIIGVDLYGQDCFKSGMNDFRKDDMYVFIDSAHSLGLPLRGDACVYSLGPTKQMPCGEGGVVVTDNEEIDAVVRLRRSHGHKGDLKSILIGMNARPQEIVSMIGLEQLKTIDKVIEQRLKLFDLFSKEFPNHLPRNNIKTIKDFALLIDPKIRDQFVSLLAERGIPTKPYYPSLTQVPSVKTKAECPIAEKLARMVVAIPFYPGLSKEERDYVIEKVHEVERILG